MRRLLPTALIPLLALLAPGLSAQASQAEGPPRAVVVVVVDQLPFQQLDRFDDLFTGGFRRLLDAGAVFTGAEHRHAVPHTAPGHATLATGAYPSSHGIVANSWVSREEQRYVYAVEDTTSPILGIPEREGRSPRNMDRPAFGTHLKRAFPSANVVSIAGKDRSAIAMGGHDADGVYWFDRGTGRFVTSAWYADAEPAWLTAFNDHQLADSLAAQPWELALEFPIYQSRVPALVRGEELRFPKPAPAQRTTPTSWAPNFAGTPGLDALTLAAAMAAAESHDVGLDDVTDLLWIGASAADFIGHTYGPGSQEAMDHLVRLDRMLGDLMTWLDERTDGRYQLVLSADHGVMPAPERSAYFGLDAGRVAPDLIERTVAEALLEAAKAEGLAEQIPQALDILSLYFLLPAELAEERHAAVRRAVADAVAAIPSVDEAVTMDEVESAGTGQPMLRLYRRSIFPGRTPDIFVRPDLYWLVADAATTAAHTTPYHYDLHVPLIFYGAAFPAGRFGRSVETVDVVPTLARALSVETPTADGVPLIELAPPEG